jgi:hypothetical protein
MSFDTLIAGGTIPNTRPSLEMKKKTNKHAPVIPEPSPRFLRWSGVAAVILLAIVLTLDYVNGWLR